MRRIFLLLLIVLAGACSMRSAIEAMSSPEDRAFAVEMVNHLRDGDSEWLRARFDPELWDRSGKQLGLVPDLFPDVPGTTEIVGFNLNTSNTGGRVERSKEFTLVTHGGGRWTVTTVATFSTGGPDRVVRWSVVPHDSPPPQLTVIETFESALPWIWGTLLVVLALIGGLIFWLVRRSRRRAQAVGTP